MKKTYEYYTTKTIDGTEEDVVILLEVLSFTSQKALRMKADSDADCYGYTSIEWHTEDDVSFITDDDVQAMEEWLAIEHEEYLWDQVKW
jgi:hypothetical protein